MHLLESLFNGVSFACGSFATLLVIAYVLRRDRQQEHAENIAHANRCEFLLTRKNEILHGMSSDVRRFVEITEKTIQGETRQQLIQRLKGVSKADLKNVLAKNDQQPPSAQTTSGA